MTRGVENAGTYWIESGCTFLRRVAVSTGLESMTCVHSYAVRVTWRISGLAARALLFDQFFMYALQLLIIHLGESYL